MEHPELLLGTLVHSQPQAPPAGERDPSKIGTFYEGFRLTDQAQRTRRIGNVGFFRQGETDLAKTFGAEEPFARSVDDVASRLGPPSRWTSTTISVVFEQSPHPDSRITLAGSRDAFGMRQLRLDWRLDEFDRRSFATAVRLLSVEAGRQRLGRFWLRPALRRTDLDDPETIRFDLPAESPDQTLHQLDTELRWGCHHMGTTRMHTDARRGVVDADCRVHGVENLYVAGSSIFPTAGISNPTLTIVALALRLADHLAAGG
jgi:choline dehydrogenase-like flavoprotein